MIDVDVSDQAHVLQDALLDRAIDPRRDLEAFLAEASRRFAIFPTPVRDAVAELAADCDPDGVLVVRNLPIDPDLPATPTCGDVDPGKLTRISELCLCGIATGLGHPVGYRYERGGAVLHDVHPMRANEQQLASDSSKVTLGLHTEMGFHSLLPDYVVLIGLRQDPEKLAETSFAGVRRALPKLTSDVRELLRSGPAAMAVEYSYARSQTTTAPQVTALYGDHDDPYLRYDADLMRSESPATAHALAALGDALGSVRGSIRVEPGMLVAFDNRRCVHGRSRFIAHYDGTDRWLQRTVVRRDLSSAPDVDPASPRLITRFL